MTEQELKQILYQRYIKPTEHKDKTFIGVEVEMPIVNLNYSAVDFDIVHSLTAAFIGNFRFSPVGIDEKGHIYSAQEKQTGDIFSYDCSYNNLELSFGRESSLNEIHRRFLIYYNFIQDYLSQYNHIVTGMGVNPFRKLNNNVPIENGRYKMLYNHLLSYQKYAACPMYFHSHPNFGMFSSASQVQLDVKLENIADVIRTFNMLEPLKALIFSNSVLSGENEDLLCCRDMLWENSTHGINPHNVGMFDCDINSTDDLLAYISTVSIYCVERDGHYINFTPTNILRYFNSEKLTGEYVENGQTFSLEFKPEESDILYLRTFKFEDLTYRGTVEFRSVCCQPISDVMAPAAFHLGLLDKTAELEYILKNDTVIYHNGYTPAELRKMFVHSELPDFADPDKLEKLLLQILELSRQGLAERNLGEEKYLEPLFERVKTHTNPALTMLSSLRSGSTIFDIIKTFAKTTNN